MLKLKKIFIVILIFIIFTSIFSQIFAATTSINGINIKPDTGTDASKKTQKLGNQIIGGIKVFGTIISVATMIIVGIKFMMGSIEEKAEYKKTLLPFFIGAVAFFGVSQLIETIYNVVRDALS